MNFAGFSQRDDLIEFLYLLAIDDDEEAVLLKRLQSFRVLVLPAQLPPGLKTIPIQDALSVCRLDETAKYVGLTTIEFLDFLADTPLHQLAQSYFFGGNLQPVSGESFSGCSLVQNGYKSHAVPSQRRTSFYLSKYSLKVTFI